MPSTKTGFHFGRSGGLARNVSLETSAYFMWSQSISPAGNPPYYLFGALRLGKNGARRPRFLVLIHDSIAPTITDAGDLGAMPAGKEGALYECTRDGWVLLDYSEYTGAYAAGATNYVYGVTLAGSNIDAVMQDDTTNYGSGGPTVRTLLPLGVLCQSPLPMFSPDDTPSALTVEFSGWSGDTSYINGVNFPMEPNLTPGFPEPPGTYYEIYNYQTDGAAGDFIVDTAMSGGAYPLGTNAWQANVRYFYPLAGDLVPLVNVRMQWQECTSEFVGNLPFSGLGGGFTTLETWEFNSAFEHPDDEVDKAHWSAKRATRRRSSQLLFIKRDTGALSGVTSQ
jgi:hypothetical protein